MLRATAVLLALHLATAEIPSYIKVCQRDDPNVDKCIMRSIEELRPKISKGIPELDVPGIEPLSLGQIALARGPQGAKLTAVVNDVKVKGPSNFIIEELKSDLDKNRFDFKLLLPRLDFAGKYKMDIHVLLLRLQGRGNITGSFKNYACNVTMRGHKEQRGGNEYLTFDPMTVKLRVGQSSIYLTNLFDGDPVLGPATNRVINDNSQGIPELDVPGIEPLSLGQIALARGPQGAKLTAVVNDVKVKGPSNFIIEELKSDLDKNRFDFKLLLPRLDFAGKYKMDIHVLLLRLQGRGNITGSFKNYACNVTMRGHKEQRGGNEYLTFDPMTVKLRVGQSSIYLTNLFDGDPVLGPATNRVINDNSQVFLSEITPVLEQSLADLFTVMANKITSKFTYKELFP